MAAGHVSENALFSLHMIFFKLTVMMDLGSIGLLHDRVT